MKRDYIPINPATLKANRAHSGMIISHLVNSCGRYIKLLSLLWICTVGMQSKRMMECGEEHFVSSDTFFGEYNLKIFKITSKIAKANLIKS